MGHTGLAQTAHENGEQEDSERIADLVLANRILADQGVVDGFACQCPVGQEPKHYFIAARERRPGDADDIMEYDLDDQPIDSRGRTPYLSVSSTARFTRFGPMSSRSSTAIRRPSSLSVPGRAAQANSHMGFPRQEVPVSKSGDRGNETDLLIRNKALGAALAQKLGNATVVLMRGTATRRRPVDQDGGVSRDLHELNARMEAEALRLGGKITFLNEIEAAKIASSSTNWSIAVGDLEDPGAVARPTPGSLSRHERRLPVLRMRINYWVVHSRA